MTDDLTVFTPEPRVVTVGGRDFSLLPLKIGKLAAFSKALLPVGGHLMGGDFATPFIQNYASLRAGIAIGSGAEESWLDELDADEFLTLGCAVVAVNAEFFRVRLLPAIQASAKAMSATMPRQAAGDR